jgi:hypothetical protein
VSQRGAVGRRGFARLVWRRGRMMALAALWGWYWAAKKGMETERERERDRERDRDREREKDGHIVSPYGSRGVVASARQGNARSVGSTVAAWASHVAAASNVASGLSHGSGHKKNPSRMWRYGGGDVGAGSGYPKKAMSPQSKKGENYQSAASGDKAMSPRRGKGQQVGGGADGNKDGEGMREREGCLSSTKASDL